MGLLESIRTLTWCQLLAGSFFALFSAWYFYTGDQLLALVYLSGCLVLLVHLLPDPLLSSDKRQTLTLLAFFLYTLVTLVLLITPEHYLSLTQLSLHLAFPYLAFSLLPFRPALLLVLGFALLANLLAMLHLEGSLRVTFLAALWLVTLMTSVYSFTHQLRQQNLKNRLNRDLHSGLFNRRQLHDDLVKEQQRAQREGTALGLLQLEQEAGQPWTTKQLTELSQCFAPFERIYSLSTQALIVLLPLGDKSQLQVRQEQVGTELPWARIHACNCAPDAQPTSLLAAVQAGNQKDPGA
ncbi:hypothetical protein [Marinospirillum sp.]|uniref:hypothetical protein n=1 Tax=Marinospirillum sp. TaxID=2183934 RepID=UPI00286FD9AB|nr:hypothetical protein [Marinospirillum sp.]MDR9468430.1 hypothetical protein [Marinospirillum sp.]